MEKSHVYFGWGNNRTVDKVFWSNNSALVDFFEHYEELLRTQSDPSKKESLSNGKRHEARSGVVANGKGKSLQADPQ